MITLDNIAQYMISAGLITNGNIYIGKVDMTKELVLGLYSKLSTDNIVAIGGYDNKGYETKTFTVFLHWNKSYKDSESKAITIFNYFMNNQSITIGTKKVFNIQCLTGQPVYIDTDNNNVHEFIIDFSITYNK